MYGRINLKNTNYKLLDNNWTVEKLPDEQLIQQIYKDYCRHKKFKSVMPIFSSELKDEKNDIILYKDNGKVVAFSILRRYDDKNVEAIQFAWNYENPAMRLGIESLKHECAFYKSKGFDYLYLGGADEYKRKIEGFEILGPI
jgi:hypothetical protein